MMAVSNNNNDHFSRLLHNSYDAPGKLYLL